jgi:hypothetical protein
MNGVSCLVEGALRVLSEADPWAKQVKTEALVSLWKLGSLPAHDGRNYTVPDRPERCDNVVKIVPSGAMPKLGKGGTLASRQVRPPSTSSRLSNQDDDFIANVSFFAASLAPCASRELICLLHEMLVL